jgi:hypothetical protein
MKTYLFYLLEKFFQNNNSVKPIIYYDRERNGQDHIEKSITP